MHTRYVRGKKVPFLGTVEGVGVEGCVVVIREVGGSTRAFPSRSLLVPAEIVVVCKTPFSCRQGGGVDNSYGYISGTKEILLISSQKQMAQLDESFVPISSLRNKTGWKRCCANVIFAF